MDTLVLHHQTSECLVGVTSHVTLRESPVADSLNSSLAAVNFFLGCVGVTQVTRIFLYQRSLKHTTIAQEAKQDAIDVSDTAKKIAEDPRAAVKKAVN